MQRFLTIISNLAEKIMNTSVAIVIPLYKAQLNSFEEISIRQCFKILSRFKIIAVKPQCLDLTDYPFKFDEVISFDDAFFADIQGYNRLMLSAIFYQSFLDFHHILIYQPDAFVFSDDLDYWCSAGYDYIGAPWLVTYPDVIKKIKNTSLAFLQTKIKLNRSKSELLTKVQFDNRVGNGGLSLRNTKKFFNICQQEIEMIAFYNQKDEHYYNEDSFWCIEVNRNTKRLTIPGYKKAVYFAVENFLPQAFKLTNGKLPFGCHAWDTHLDFWRPIFKEAGVNI